MSIVRFDAIISVSYSSITNSYAALGSATQHPWRIIRMINTTDASMLLSFNGSTDNVILPSNSFVLYDFATNAAPVNDLDNFLLSINTQIYIKYISAPTGGAVYVEGLYARGE